MSNTGTLFARVTKVMQTVKALEPDKKHQQGYMYISSDKALNMIGAAMAQNGLVIVPSVTSQTVDIVEYTNQQNKAMTRFDASVTFAMTLADADGNDHTAVWVGSGSDFTSPDKAVYKAITSGHKYFMLKLFVVGAGAEDSEHEEAEPGRVQKVGRQTSSPITAPPANGKPAPSAEATVMNQHNAAGIGWDELANNQSPRDIAIRDGKQFVPLLAKQEGKTEGEIKDVAKLLGMSAISKKEDERGKQWDTIVDYIYLTRNEKLPHDLALAVINDEITLDEARKQVAKQPALIDAPATAYAE